VQQRRLAGLDPADPGAEARGRHAEVLGQREGEDVVGSGQLEH
jgi:hypothetical protein